MRSLGERVAGSRQNAAIRFAPDGFDLAKPWLMGRQVAGNGFLRAVVAARGDDPVTGYGPGQGLSGSFRSAVRAIDPRANVAWIDLAGLDGLNRLGVCHRPDPAIGLEARLRLRVGSARHCLTGVTHTTASEGAVRQLVDLLGEPLMPWDAVICTSQAVAETVRRLHAPQADYLRWRHGPDVALAAPQLPVIPLGVHSADFEFTSEERAAARSELNLEADNVLALFVGRLAFVAKAHPQVMYEGLQAAMERTGKQVVLAQCGWSPNGFISNAYAQGAAEFAPSVRSIILDGRNPESRRRCWAAADLFLSLSDNLQETFGLTPLEAMAAGLPVVVTDWNGYRDTVRDGVDGFRIQTWAPAAGYGEYLARGFEAETIDYDRRNWAAASTTSVDFLELVDRLAALIGNPELRRSMGEAGRERARMAFDWAHIFGQYQALWGELNARRLAAAEDPEQLAWLAAAPKSSPNHPDPFDAFGHYPSHTITADTVVSLAAGASPERYRALAANNLWPELQTRERFAAALLLSLESGPATVGSAARTVNSTPALAVSTVGLLAKMGLVTLRTPIASTANPSD
jgi:glycosyltransferase involved in cell wall biosynthesis